jgi:hypothetical protein
LAQALTAGTIQSGWRPTPDAYGPPSEADAAAERRSIDRSNSLSARIDAAMTATIDFNNIPPWGLDLHAVERVRLGNPLCRQ